MNDDKLIYDYLNNLKRESGINEPKTDTSPDTNICESAETPAVTPAHISEQPYQPEPVIDYEKSVPDNNTNTSIAQSVLNLFGGLAQCFNKYVQIPGYPAYAFICSDSNHNAYLCVLNMQTKQPECIANILLENSEFAVYQNCQRTGTLYGNDNQQVWQFIPNGMPIPNQNPQYIQPSTPNNLTYKYVFNNVPFEQAGEIIDSVTRNNPSSNLEINFTSPSTATEDHADEIVIPPEHYSTD